MSFKSEDEFITWAKDKLGTAGWLSVPGPTATPFKAWYKALQAQMPGASLEGWLPVPGGDFVIFDKAHPRCPTKDEMKRRAEANLRSTM